MTVVRGKEAGEAAAMAAKLEPPQIVEGRRGCRHRLCGAFNRVENSKSRKIRVTLAVAWHKNYSAHYIIYILHIHYCTIVFVLLPFRVRRRRERSEPK